MHAHKRERLTGSRRDDERYISKAIDKRVKPGSEMITDMLRSYWAVRDRYTNGLENFWSLLKRGLRGTYIAVDAFHLHRYVDEQVFRYNQRRDPDGDAGRFVKALRRIVGKRLTYRDLTSDPGLATTPA